MSLRATCAVVAGVCLLAASPAAAGDVVQLKKQIEKLQAEIKKLQGGVERAEQPINLGRTSLAAVNASSVNGNRSLSNVYYGVVNAFDDGANWHNNINYTYWLSDNGPGAWVEVHFDHPVSVTSICVDNGPPFATKLVFAQGGERVLGQAGAEVKLDGAVQGIKSVRLTFAEQAPAGGGMVAVHEIRILGHPPADARFMVGRPRVWVDAAQAVRAAEESLAEWLAKATRPTRHEVREDGEKIVVTFFRQEAPIYRVALRRADGAATALPLARLTPLADAKKP